MLESSSYSFHKLQICPLSEHVQQEDIQGLPLKFWFSHQISCFLKSPVADHILKFNFILLFPKWEAPVAHMLGRQLMAFCAALSKFRVKFSWLCRKPTSSSCETSLYGLQRYLPAVAWVGYLLNSLPSISSGYVLHWASPFYTKSCVHTHFSPFESKLSTPRKQLTIHWNASEMPNIHNKR